MAPLPDHTPDITKFTTFLRNVARISVGNLPDNSPSIQHAFDYAAEMVNLDLGIIPAAPGSWSIYEQAVYNLATHTLIEYAQDASYPILALSWSAGVVSATTNTPHQMMPGDQIKIVGVSPLAYGGSGAVTLTAVPDNTHFGYLLPRDPGGAMLLSGAAAQSQFFADARRVLKLNSFTPGIVGSTSDLSTSVSLDVPEFFKHLTLDQLQLLKTPYGRAYLRLAQRYGPTVWGIT